MRWVSIKAPSSFLPLLCPGRPWVLATIKTMTVGCRSDIPAAPTVVDPFGG